MSRKIAIIGTNGIPSKYGGFETLVEYLAEYLGTQYDITIYCSSKTSIDKKSFYKNCKLEYIPLNANGWQSIIYDIVSIFKSHKKFDKILVLGCSGSIVMPLLLNYRNKFIMNLGGLDWQRSKWGFYTRKFLKFSEKMAVKYSGDVISDNLGIKEYLRKEYNCDSILITYGGDQVEKIAPQNSHLEKYPFLKSGYAFSVARIQPDNNIDMLLESFDETSPFPIVIVGNWHHSTYGKNILKKFINHPNIILLNAIYDQKELNILRSNCKVYLHAHSAGGTNPALVEAMNLSLPILTYDCVYNRYTTNSKALYFADSEELSKKIKSLSEDDLNTLGKNMYAIAKDIYQWEKIAKLYSTVIDK